jgi:hypothetical protein
MPRAGGCRRAPAPCVGIRRGRLGIEFSGLWAKGLGMGYVHEEMPGSATNSVYTVFRFNVAYKPTTAPNTDLRRIRNRNQTEKPKNRYFGSVQFLVFG